MGKCVCLSAGIPDQPARGHYVDTADPVAIRDSVRALAGVVLRRDYQLVFGGHPAISPLVAQVADSLDRLERVIIYQSRWFEDIIPHEAKRFWNFRWTERESTLEASLQTMRREMVGAGDLEFVAAVFIGGMDGIEREYALFTESWPNVPTVLVGSTGGAALDLWRKHPHPHAHLHERLESDMLYQSLFADVLP